MCEELTNSNKRNFLPYTEHILQYDKRHASQGIIGCDWLAMVILPPLAAQPEGS